ncbi:MAG: zinc ribbon domain-containing protein [bacterium]|nr:zinc ribbon domain-containing protein [bacterium]
MAIYEYKCSKCDHKFSAMLSISKRDEEEKTLTCPECEAGEPRRLLSLFSMPASVGAPGGGGSKSAPCPDAKGCPASKAGG